MFIYIFNQHLHWFKNTTGNLVHFLWTPIHHLRQSPRADRRASSQLNLTRTFPEDDDSKRWTVNLSYHRSTVIPHYVLISQYKVTGSAFHSFPLDLIHSSTLTPSQKFRTEYSAWECKSQGKDRLFMLHLRTIPCANGLNWTQREREGLGIRYAI